MSRAQVIMMMILVTGAMATDLYKGKIYNFWLLPAFFAGILSRLFPFDPKEIQSLLTSFLMALALSICVYTVGAVRAGDCKFLITAAVFMNPNEFFSCFVFSFFIAGLEGICILIRSGGKNHALRFALPAGLSILLHLGGFF